MSDATPATPVEKLVNQIVNLLCLAEEVGEVDFNECMLALQLTPKAFVIRVQDDQEEDAAIAHGIPPRTGQYDDDDMALEA